MAGIQMAVTNTVPAVIVPSTVQFTSVGTTSWTPPTGVYSVEYLVVGGGGGGGQAADNSGGGGGGAGMVLTGNIAVTPGQSYTVTIGAGGAGGNSGSNVGAQNGSTGSNSVFSTITALGGGGGYASRANQNIVGNAQISNTTAATGGGGGPGGGGGLGGGGASGAGSARSGTTGGAGGAGTSSTIIGGSVTYGAGASGGNSGTQNGGDNGTANRGNGGGGGGATSANYRAGGDGGSGIVVVRYGTAYPPFTWYEAFGAFESTEAISTTQYVGSTKIYAYSSTYDVLDYQPAVVAVNDVEIVNTENRGHTMVVLDPSGATVSINWYDTYIDPAQLTALANALNGVASGNRVVLVVYDASALDATVRSAINSGYGSTNTNTWTAERISHILIGIKS
jgi:hypothetical protein